MLSCDEPHPHQGWGGPRNPLYLRFPVASGWFPCPRPQACLAALCHYGLCPPGRWTWGRGVLQTGSAAGRLETPLVSEMALGNAVTSGSVLPPFYRFRRISAARYQIQKERGWAMLSLSQSESLVNEARAVATSTFCRHACLCHCTHH